MRRGAVIPPPEPDEGPKDERVHDGGDADRGEEEDVPHMVDVSRLNGRPTRHSTRTFLRRARTFPLPDFAVSNHEIKAWRLCARQPCKSKPRCSITKQGYLIKCGDRQGGLRVLAWLFGGNVPIRYYCLL